MHLEMFGASVLVGLMSGWLAGIAMKGGGYGLLWDIIFGLSGSFVGSWIFQTLAGPEAGWGGTGIAAFGGGGLLIPLQRQNLAAQGAPPLGTGSEERGGGESLCEKQVSLLFLRRGSRGA